MVETEKNETLADLATVTSQLDDQKALTQDLLQQLDQDTESAGNVKRKNILVLMDETRFAIRAYLSDKYNWTICTFADNIPEIKALTSQKLKLMDEHVKEITSHDMIILSCGRSHISNGESGRQVTNDLKTLTTDLTNLTGLEVCVLAIPPTRARPGQALLCNIKLQETLKDIRGVTYLPLTTLMGTDKVTTVFDDNTLTPAGGRALGEFLNNLTVSGTRRMPNKEDKEPDGDKGDKSDKDDKKPDKDDKKPDKEGNSSGETSEDKELVEEIMSIKHSYIGPIIGHLGHYLGPRPTERR